MSSEDLPETPNSKAALKPIPLQSPPEDKRKKSATVALSKPKPAPSKTRALKRGGPQRGSETAALVREPSSDRAAPFAVSQIDAPTEAANVPPQTEAAPLSDQEIESAGSDSLVEALVYFGRVYGQPVNRHGILQGLPVRGGRLSPDLFDRAASRCGFQTRLMRRKLSSIHESTLPVILILKNQEAIVLKSVIGSDAEIVQFKEGGQAQLVSLRKLKKSYAGMAIFVRPSFAFEGRSDFNAKTLGKNWFWGTLWKFRSFYARVAVASLVSNFLALTSSIFVMNVYDRVVPNEATDTLFVLAVGVGIAYLFEFLLKMARSMFIDRAGRRIDMILGSEIYGRLLGMRLGDRPQSAGSLASQARAYESLREFFTSASVAAIVDLPFVGLFIFVIYLLGGLWVAVPLLVGVILALLIGLIMQFPIVRAVRDSYQAANQRQALMVEGIQAGETIKATRSESQMQSRMEEVLKISSNADVKSRGYSHLAMNGTAFVNHLVSTSIIIFAFFAVLEGDLTMGKMIACVILSGRAMAPMSLVASLLTRFQQSRRSLEGLNQIMEMPLERENKGQRYISVLDFHPEIKAEDLTYSYDPEAPVPAVDGVNLHIKPGERVAILGRIGSGKSSLIRLLMGFHQPQKGGLTVSGVDSRQFDPAELRARIGYAPQDPTLLYGSLRTNLTTGCPWVKDESILDALNLAGLADFLRSLPKGIDQPVSEGGRSLSGGQRQAISLARAVVEKPELLIFDEPTSAMDSGTERRVLTHLKEYLEANDERTLIVATHKRSVLELVDRVIVMDQGKVVADGPKDKIMQAAATAASQPQDSVAEVSAPEETS